MKFKIQSLTIALLALSAGAMAQTGNSDQNGITVTVNGNPVQFRGEGPIMSQDRVFVPLRGVFQRMGAHVDWDPSTQTVSADRGQTHVRLTIGLRSASINGEPTNLDLPPQVIDGVTMVPLRFVSEALGANVDWDAQDQTVMISSGNYPIPPAGEIRDNIGSRPMRLRMPTILQAGTLIQARLINDISSDRNQQGDRITADVTSNNSAGLPRGAKLEGYVAAVRQRTNNRPGWLSLQFTTLVMPNGKTYPVSGSFTGLGRVGANWVHSAHFESGTVFGVRLATPIRFRK